MDVLSDLLHRARARNASIRQLIQRPPWSLTYADAPVLTVVAALGGRASIRLDDRPGAEPTSLTAGDIALIGDVGRYTVADDPATPPRIVIHGGGRKQLVGDRDPAALATWQHLAPRTYGDGLPGATVLLRSTYDLHGTVGERLLSMLPPLAVVPAGPRTRPALELLTAETARDEPGQDGVVRQLLDLVLLIALRAWYAEPGASRPDACRALADPAVGLALRLLHGDPARRWTVAGLATEVGLARATFAARFNRLVGEPPLGYLTTWRMALAADLLRDTDQTIAVIAREVGYADPFAFSAAFKRALGVSPSTWRTSC